MIVCSIVSQTLLTAEPFLTQHVLTEHCTKTESEERNFLWYMEELEKYKFKSFSVANLQLFR